MQAEKVMLETLRRLPKVELHAHLSASLSRKSLTTLLIRKGKNPDLSFLNCEDLESIFAYTFKVLKECCTCRDDLTFITHAALDDFIEDNVKYIELRSTPKKLGDISELDYIDTVIEAFKSKEEDITARFLISINRVIPGEYYHKLFDRLSTDADWQKYVVGLDFSGDPYQNTVEYYNKEIRRARELGLKLALHAAEIPNQYEETQSILNYKTERLGHFCWASEEQILQAKEYGAIVEVCPSSNMKTNSWSSMEEHVMRQFLKLGVKVAICTDDLLIFDESLSDEIFKVCNAFNLDYDYCKQVALNSIDAAFIKDEDFKTSLKAQIQNDYDLVIGNKG